MYIALYARQSIERENSASVETQFEYCKTIIRPDEKKLKIRQYTDKGFSGKNIDRPGFQELMRDVRRGKIKRIIVYKLDRISRSLIDFVDILDELKKYNVEFSSSQECFDSSSPYGEMISKLLMVFAEYERTSIINRIRDTYDKRADMALYNGGRRPYGYILEDAVIGGVKTKKYVINPEEAEQIKYIFEIYSQPSVTLRRLQANLIEKEIKSLDGSDWTTGKLSSLIKNPLYVKADADIYDYYRRKNTKVIGDLEAFDGTHNVQLYGKTTHDKTLPDWSDMKIVLLKSEGIVGSSVWIKCQNKLENNKQIGNSLSNNTSWLAGKIVCEKCGHKMSTFKGDNKKYFLCTGRTHKKTCTGVKCTIYVDDIENMVDDCIRNKLTTLKFKKVNYSQENLAQINALKLKLKEIEEKQVSLGEMVLSGDFNRDMIKIMNEKSSKLNQEKDFLLEQLDELSVRDKTVKESINFIKKWAKANFKERRAICNVLIKSIIISEDGSTEIIWNI